MGRLGALVTCLPMFLGLASNLRTSLKPSVCWPRQTFERRKVRPGHGGWGTLVGRPPVPHESLIYVFESTPSERAVPAPFRLLGRCTDGEELLAIFAVRCVLSVN